MEHIIKPLIDNSKSAMISCIELHNKPIFPYRYQVCVVLAITAWEKLLKAYILGNHVEVNIICEDGTTKPFDECVKFVSSNLGKEFRVIEENISKVYEYRCNIIHFYEENINHVLFSLLHKNVLFYNDFLKDKFNIDMAEETNLFLLPIGFKPYATPIDFLGKKSELEETSDAVQKFIKSIVKSTKNLLDEGIEDSILSGFTMTVINENRIKNADIIAGISKDPSKAKVVVTNVLSKVKITDDENVKEIAIDEQSLFKTVYVFNHHNVVKKSRGLYSNFKQNQKFNDIIRSVKGNPTYHKCRYLNPHEQKGMGQDWYSAAVFDELDKNYTRNENEQTTLHTAQRTKH